MVIRFLCRLVIIALVNSSRVENREVSIGDIDSNSAEVARIEVDSKRDERLNSTIEGPKRKLKRAQTSHHWSDGQLLQQERLEFSKRDWRLEHMKESFAINALPVESCQRLPDFDNKHQFFNGYCPFPANLATKFPSFQIGETYPNGVRCDGHVRFRNAASVGKLRQVYNDEIRSSPAFITALIRLRKDPVSDFDSKSQYLELSAYLRAPQLYSLWKYPAAEDYNVGVYFAPNLGYNMLRELELDSNEPYGKTVKNHIGGITYTAWFLHPFTLSGQDWKKSGSSVDRAEYDINNWDDPELVKAFVHKANKARSRRGGGLEPPVESASFQRTKASEGKRLVRPKYQMTGSELFEASGKKYYSTILDFEKSDLELLKTVRANVIQKLEELHGLALPEKCPSGKTKRKGNDALLLYFHFPYALNTVTVHLHARMNQGIHPFEAQYSFFLDDIIIHLEQHSDIYGLVMSRVAGVQQHTATSPFARGIGCIGKHVAALFEQEPYNWNSRKDLGVTFESRWDAQHPNTTGLEVTETVAYYCPNSRSCGQRCVVCDRRTNKYPSWMKEENARLLEIADDTH
eukprot:TRINITY_DN23783_c0_g1_i1.p1 TRINITY_DN23783_c0_g1~~TRINITY_DN23783_c0_g1_i1.p1  ORF type:complete len:574 (-),score=73.99 TRINITY_DN23783_c0_g1_i1:304-2025(-)